MKHLDKLKKAALPLLAAVLVLGAAAGDSSSYFTTYVTAEGGYTLRLRDARVDVDDTMDGNTKQITVANVTDEPCYVRARVLQASTVQAVTPITYAGEGWFDGGDGYWYYSDILTGTGDTAAQLRAAIDLPQSSAERPIPEGTTFNVTVIAECAKILYNADGTAMANGPAYPGWTLREG